MSDTDRIQKTVVIRAPRSRVWSAISDAKEFGEWFRVKITGTFTPGAHLTGHITYTGYEHVEWNATIDRMEPERLFSFRWHPYAVDPGKDYSAEPTTLVVFELEDVAEGTKLTVTESGFDRIPLERRAKAFRGNEEGWEKQTKLIAKYLARGSD